MKVCTAGVLAFSVRLSADLCVDGSFQPAHLPVSCPPTPHRAPCVHIILQFMCRTEMGACFLTRHSWGKGCDQLTLKEGTSGCEAEGGRGSPGMQVP